VTVERDELRRLVDDLPDEQVPAALEDVRRRVAPREATPWPPSWFGMGVARRTDTAARADEILAEGFGR
jgi:hypothetical protein